MFTPARKITLRSVSAGTLAVLAFGLALAALTLPGALVAQNAEPKNAIPAATAEKAEKTAEPAEKPPENSDEVNDRLANKRFKVSFVDIPLADAIDFIGEKAGVNTFIDQAALNDLGLDEPKVTLKLRFPVSASQALKLALRSVHRDLTYTVDQEVVLIEKVASAEPSKPAPPEMQTQAYNIQDFAADNDTGAALLQWITENVKPEEWKAKGGESKITRIGTRLLVIAPEDTHKEIADLLATLRDATGDDNNKDDNGDSKEDNKPDKDSM